MSTFIKGEKITDHYKLEDELGRYPLTLYPTVFLKFFILEDPSQLCVAL